MKFLDRAKGAVRQAVRAPVGLAAQWMSDRLPDSAHELAVCAIFREEAPFLDEWISFHTGVGVTHFYLYNNFSTDNFRDVLAPWIARGTVTLIDWPKPVGQFSAYRDCIKRTRRTCRWVAFIDIDEFLFAPDTTDIRPILRRYRDLPGVEVWQVFFGSGGHDARPALPVTDAYLKRAPFNRTTVKTIANPRMAYKVGVHQFKYWHGTALDPARRIVVKDQAPVLDVLRINHYWSRSLEDLRTKIQRNDASTPVPRDPEWHFAFEQTLNAETDDTILPVVRAIRAAAKAAPRVTER
jgi:hypothetical protein